MTVGFSKVPHGIVEEFLVRLGRAEITEKMITEITKEEGLHAAYGMMLPAVCRELCAVQKIKPHNGSIKIGMGVTLTLPDGETELEGQVNVISVNRSFGSRSIVRSVSLDPSYYTELTEDWEAIYYGRGQIKVRRKLERNVWVDAAFGWEAFYTANGSYMIRPTPK